MKQFLFRLIVTQDISSFHTKKKTENSHMGLLPVCFLPFQLRLLHYDTLKAHNMQISAWPDVPTVFKVSSTTYV